MSGFSPDFIVLTALVMVYNLRVPVFLVTLRMTFYFFFKVGP